MTESKRRDWDIHGYVIVSRDHCIADANGDMPESLHNEADWTYFQTELAKARAVILGREAHEATPNTAKRLRIIMTRSVSGLEACPDGWFWNPAKVDFVEMAQRIVPGGGRIAVPGGRGPFDWFLHYGFDGFHLARKHNVSLLGGVPVFTGCDQAMTPEALMTERGLKPGPEVILDDEPPVTMTVWR